MSAADRNKIAIAGAIAVVAIIAILFFVMRGRGKGQPPATAAGGFGVAQQQPGVPGAAAPGQAAPAAPGAGAAVPGSPGAAGVELAAAPAAAVALTVPGTPILMGAGPELPTRSDPFVTFNPPPVPVPPELTFSIPPVTLQQGGLRPPGVTEVAAGTIGRRRVAGLLFDEGAWAILEQDGKTFIVKPGDVVEGNRITAIGPGAIFVTDPEGRRWRVTLRSLAPGAGAAGATASSTVPGMPETPPAGY